MRTIHEPQGKRFNQSSDRILFKASRAVVIAQPANDYNLIRIIHACFRHYRKYGSYRCLRAYFPKNRASDVLYEPHARARRIAMHPRWRVLMLRISWGITRFLTAKRLYIVAQGKQRRVLRAFVSPWVEEARDPRPRTPRFFRRRVVEAETCRGFFTASANFRAKATVTPRPRAFCHRTQGGGKARIA